MKKTILYILLELIFLILFNTVFFLVGGFSHPVSVWISYGFIHFAYIMVLATPFLVRKGSSSSVFGRSLQSISCVYFFAEFIAGVLFILIGADHFKMALLTQLIIAGIYGILLLGNLIANEHTAEQVERRERETAYLKEASSRVKFLLGKLPDKKADKEIEKLYDLLHSSPSRSTKAVESLEADIMSRLVDLEKAVQKGDPSGAVDLANTIYSLTERRNSILKSSN